MAEYYLGKTIDPDEDHHGKFLKIEGEKYPYKEEGALCYYDFFHEDGGKTFCKDLTYSSEDVLKNKAIELGKIIIDLDPRTKKLAGENQIHLDKLKKGVDYWNNWREENPHIRPILYEIKYELIKEAAGIEGLKRINFSNANLIEADLTGADLTKANFHEANLGGAKLIRAILREANFCRADFYKTNFSGADLTNANLQGAQIASANFENAGQQQTKISNCKVYGSSAWDLKNLDGAVQEKLKIVYQLEPEKKEYSLYVDDLRMAQFLYFILNNKNLAKFFTATNSSVVLILGRFANGGKTLLENIRDRVGTHSSSCTDKKYIPILFDFEKSRNYSYTEIITILAGISKFVIADLTDSKSIPQELQAIVGGFRRPLIPIVRHSAGKNASENVYSLFADHFRYDWVHPVIGYLDDKDLFNHFDDLILMTEQFCDTIEKKMEAQKNEILPIETIHERLQKNGQ